MDHQSVHLTHIFILKGDFTWKSGKLSDFQKIDINYKKSIINQNRSKSLFFKKKWVFLQKK